MSNQKLVGLYIELKSPSYYRSIGLPMEETFLNLLKSHGIDSSKQAAVKAPVVLQCFELDTLALLSKQTDLPLVYLMDQNTSYSLPKISEIANGVGPHYSSIWPSLAERFNPTSFIAEAHANNLVVHPWVFRDDQFEGYSPAELYSLAYYQGWDGIFTEFPDDARSYFEINSRI